MVRITDVAREAGVSPSTVSHVLSGKRTISQRTKDKVLATIQKLGYSPNPNAQALKTQRSGIIGFFASDITELFVARTIRGVERVVRDNDSYLLFASGVEFGHDLYKAVSFLKNRRPDGIIISYAISHLAPPEEFKHFNIPLVTINHFLSEKYPGVLPDNIQGGYRAALHLLESGAKTLALIAGQKDRIASQDRKSGFLKALRDHHISFPASHLYYGDFTYHSGEQGLRSLLQKDADIDGIFCLNDYMAAGAVHAALRMGIRVPGDLKVLGYDNREFSAFGPVPISTFAQPLEQMGQISAELLFSVINNQPLKSHKLLLPSTLIKRESTATVPEEAC